MANSESGSGSEPVAAPLVREAAPPARTGPRTPLLIAAAVVLVLLAAGAGGWWYFMGRTAAPDWARVPDIALAAPAGDAFLDETPWVTLQLVPARPGEQNTIRVGLRSRQGTPAAANEDGPRIVELTARPMADPEGVQSLPLQPEGDASGALLANSTFDQSGWWRLGVRVEVAGEDREAPFYLLFPDPNINGPGAVPRESSSPDGEALYQRGLTALTSLTSVRYTQWLSDGRGNAGISEHAVTAGGEGQPPGFSYRAPDGMEAVVIGSTRWVRLPNDFGWTRQDGAASVPPSEWGEEYAGATGFAILGEELIDGAPTQIVSFVVPEVVEPRRQTAAWYLWWVDVESGNILQETMVSRVHYMRNDFSGFDEPLTLQPPEGMATPGAGTPTP